MFVFFGIFFGVAALASDLAQTANRGQELQSAADAAALAGVVEYEEVLLATASEDMAKAAADLKAREVLTQNGIVPDGNVIIADITFPAVGGQVRVRVDDKSVKTVLGPIVQVAFPFEHNVERNATAEFLGCNACGVILPIPKPFKAVDADGEGDGFIPIEVGDRLYALNHNSSDNQIICVDTDAEEPCWREGDVDTAPFEINRDAYTSSSTEPGHSPEMPHTGVVDEIIWWSASNSTGHHLFCFNTTTDTPCSTTVQLGNDPRANRDNMPLLFNEGATSGARFKDEARGGGTFEFMGRIFAFTDNHEIHCWNPASGGACLGYDGPFGGMPTGLDVFPDNDPVHGNHGGSIDRIVDQATGYVYSTIHIPGADLVDTLDCAASVPELDADDLIDEIVTIEAGNQYLSGIGVDNVQMTANVNDPVVRWHMTRESGSDDVYFESLTVLDEWLDGEDDPALIPSNLNTDVTKIETDNAWILAPQPGGGFTLELRGEPTTPISFLNLTPLGAAEQNTGAATVWTISRCTDPAREAGYAPGTWLHCYNTGLVEGSPGPCDKDGVEFVSDAPLHVDGSRFSGRLWFDYDFAIPGTAATKAAVCSSGLTAPFQRGTDSTVEIVCVDLDSGAVDTTVNNYSVLADKITDETGSAPGAWGLPHYNVYQNRLIYPTQHNSGLVICWEFNTDTTCGEFVGETSENASTPNQDTEDYGYISKGNCVFALGHEEFFWAFQAGGSIDGAFGDDCLGATAEVSVKRCLCNGLAVRWGVLDLSSIDLTEFDVLRVKVTTDPDDEDVLGDLIWPEISGVSPRDSWHELTPPASGSPRILLDDILGTDTPNPYPGDSVRIMFYVEAPPETFGGGNVPQGEVRFLIRPRLVE